MSQGCNKVEQLFADQKKIVQEHLDRRLENQAQREAKQRACRRFKDSLFFPELFEPQDEIPRSHEGTCRWIFGPPKVRGSQSPEDTVNEKLGDSDDKSLQDHSGDSLENYNCENQDDNDDKSQDENDDDSFDSESRTSKWSDFVVWLKNGKDTYW